MDDTGNDFPSELRQGPQKIVKNYGCSAPSLLALICVRRLLSSRKPEDKFYCTC